MWRWWQARCFPACFCHCTRGRALTGAVRGRAGVDITEEESLERVVQALGGRRISLLIVASGIQQHDTLETVTKESIRTQLEVNALGPLFAVRKLQPELQQGGKVVLLSSKNASIAETEKTGGDLVRRHTRSLRHATNSACPVTSGKSCLLAAVWLPLEQGGAEHGRRHACHRPAATQ